MKVSAEIRQRAVRWLVRVSRSSTFINDVLRSAQESMRRKKDFEAIRLNIKNFGYELARQASQGISRAAPPVAPVKIGLSSKPTTQRDIESDWLAYWCARLRIQPVYHRKIWELCYVLQALWERGLLRDGSCGLGFGCGAEPLPSLMAAYGVHVTATDLSAEQVVGRGWMETGQHASELAKLHHPGIVAKDRFESHVDLRYIDMNRIPQDLYGAYDFCWSVCAYEHLGSIAKGLRFVREAMNVLKPGGVAVHTTEFNFLNDQRTLDNWPTVLFQRKHFEQLYADLQADGHRVAPLDFDVGEGAIDRYIDIPPYTWNATAGASWFNRFAHQAHLKLSIDGLPSTCFGLIVQKADVV